MADLKEMRIIPLKLLLFVFFILISSLISPCVQSETPAKNVTQVRRLTETEKQIAVLEAQLETSRFYDARVTNIIIWSLSTVVIIGGVLIGWGWYTNYRVYERDKKLLLQELMVELQAKQTELNTFLSKKTDEISTGVNTVIKSAVEPLKNEILGDLRRIRFEIRQLEIKQLQMISDEYDKKGYLSMVFNARAKILKLEIEDGIDVTIGRALDDVREVLVRINNKNIKLDSNSIGALTDTLSNISPTHRVVADSIRKML